MSSKKNESISKQLEAFEESLSWFESDDFNLEEAVQKYEESAKIANELEESLIVIKNKVEVLKKSFQD